MVDWSLILDLHRIQKIGSHSARYLGYKDAQLLAKSREHAQTLGRVISVISTHKLKAQLGRYAMNTIGYILRAQNSTTPFCPSVKDDVYDALFALISLCSDHELDTMSVSLDTAGKVLFKRLYEKYTTYHKYEGKV
jgi:hypothetical protein